MEEFMREKLKHHENSTKHRNASSYTNKICNAPYVYFISIKSTTNVRGAIRGYSCANAPYRNSLATVKRESAMEKDTASIGTASQDGAQKD
ncbi:MAG: hypothetical protein AAGM45_20990, partial [Cyanobacteria bacterium J06588_5]